MEHASAADRIDKDVQLDEKKPKCRHGQAGAYPGKKGSLIRGMVGVISDHWISPRTTNMKLRADRIVMTAAQSNDDGRGPALAGAARTRMHAAARRGARTIRNRRISSLNSFFIAPVWLISTRMMRPT
jgi:hypothetical protein